MFREVEIKKMNISEGKEVRRIKRKERKRRKRKKGKEKGKWIRAVRERE
ncbi:hypothetical protein HUC01_23030 [Escherichia coli]|nr:hypothetical protein [Escherichia coli]